MRGNESPETITTETEDAPPERWTYDDAIEVLGDAAACSCDEGNHVPGCPVPGFQRAIRVLKVERSYDTAIELLLNRTVQLFGTSYARAFYDAAMELERVRQEASRRISG